MKWLDHATQTVFADLNQRAIDASFDADYPENGSFAKSRIKGREYWYYSGYDALTGTKLKKYVGPVSDDAITSRVEDFNRIKSALQTRLEAVRMLRAAGLPTPDGMTGAVLERISKAGFFRLRGVLVGTVAFQTYSGLVGARLERHLQTGDVDLAQDHGISVAIAETIAPMLAEMQELDPSFRQVPHISERRNTAAFINSRGYKIEFLVPNRGSDDHADTLTSMPALGEVAAQPLRFLDFLIRHPVRSVLLHGGGVSVLVPAPERFAVHKLIVAARRRDREKSHKDIGQSEFLIEALTKFHGLEIADAWIEAWLRGPKWRQALSAGKSMLAPSIKKLLNQAVAAHAGNFNVKPGDAGIN
jgi:hypothetical protein